MVSGPRPRLYIFPLYSVAINTSLFEKFGGLSVTLTSHRGFVAADEQRSHRMRKASLAPPTHSSGSHLRTGTGVSPEWQHQRKSGIITFLNSASKLYITGWSNSLPGFLSWLPGNRLVMISLCLTFWKYQIISSPFTSKLESDQYNCRD